MMCSEVIYDKKDTQPEFKLEAVRLAKSGVPKAQLARDLEIGPNLLRIWLGKHEADAGEPFQSVVR